MKLSFRKMHGTGNDFVVLDARAQSFSMTTELAAKLADRHFGIGCDQLVVLHQSPSADVRMQIFNADGSEISTCGNATRCVADLVMREHQKPEAKIETAAGVRTGVRSADGVVVNMGVPKFEWDEIPLAEKRNTLHLGLQEGLLLDPVAVNMGNPHIIFFVRDLQHIRLAEWGPKLEHHPLFPERTNVSAVQILSPQHIKMATWERGTGLTMACGSAACASVVAGVSRELIQRKARVDVPGGSLTIEWQAGEQGAVMMAGATADVFEGTIEI